MDTWYKVNWQELFIPSIPLVELIVRGSLVYLILFSVLRFIPSRQLGTLGITDVLVVVLFAEAAQNAMATNYTSITEGAILVFNCYFLELFPQLDCLLFSTFAALFESAAFTTGEKWSLNLSKSTPRTDYRR